MAIKKDKKISGATKVIGIFGDPISHTLSPAIQNAALEKIGIDAVYLPFHVKAAGLKKAIEGARSMGFLGVNITIPHKEAVIKYLDEVDEYAREIGAVNTIVNRDGKLIGFNTDGLGYLASLHEETGLELKNKNIMILGAGGSARAILYALLKEEPVSIIIANRTVSKAKTLAKAFSKKGVKIRAAGLVEAAGFLRETHLLINTTSIGLNNKGSFDLPLNELPKGAVVSDIVYKPLKTGLIKTAQKHRIKTHAGIGMLIHQGALGFKLWTGKAAPVNAMRKAALAGLE